MRTTLNIDDELYRAVKIKAITEHRTVTDLVNAALRGLLVQGSLPDTQTTPRRTAPPFPRIDTKPLEPAPTRTLGISEFNALIKETELESDLERYDATPGH